MKPCLKYSLSFLGVFLGLLFIYSTVEGYNRCRIPLSSGRRFPSSCGNCPSFLEGGEEIAGVI